ncbi:MAG: response regulator transcription factor [Lachnospiraceae bacterium]|nr:response regulator transcription factor [Lachnospiraceae bacterium]
MCKIMLIDDDFEVLSINRKYFSNEGYDVDIFSDAQAAIDSIDKLKPDCIILDIMMPGLNGMDALSLIRKKCSAPVIFLTGKDSEDDKINGLLGGADDYMVKPYSLKELSARIKVQLRKNSNSKKNDFLSFPPISVDIMNHKLFYNDTDEISISQREYELFYLLVSNANIETPFEEIGMKIWNYYQKSDRQSIMMITSRLRKKLEKYKGLENCIETIYGKGYRFVPPNNKNGK